MQRVCWAYDHLGGPGVPFCCADGPVPYRLPLVCKRAEPPGAIDVDRGNVLAGVAGVDARAGVCDVRLGLDALRRCSVLIGNLVLQDNMISVD